MPFIGSLYSGIGGADAGFSAAGWQVVYQAEIDPRRREVLAKHWPGVTRIDDVARVCAASTPVRLDVCYAELPDPDLYRWWPEVLTVAREQNPKWLVIECSPSVPCDDILRDLALDGWHFRVVQCGIILTAPNIQEQEWHVRQRLFIFASRSREAARGIGVKGFGVMLTLGLGRIEAVPGTPEYHEATIGLPNRWSCVCGRPECACDQQERIQQLIQTTPPHLAFWAAQLLSGHWSSDLGYTYDVPNIQ